MDHVKALLTKFIAILAVLFIVLTLFYSVPFRYVFTLAVVLTIVAYVIGDLLVLRNTNNATATVADFFLTYLIIWFMTRNISYPINEPFADDIFALSLISTILITAFEYFFHKYVDSHVFDDMETDGASKLDYQTETAEEFTPSTNDEKDNE